MKKISYVLTLSVAILVALVFFSDFNYMYSDQRTLIGFDVITNRQGFNSVEGTFSPVKSGNTVSSFIQDFEVFIEDKGYSGYIRYEENEDESGVEKRYVLPSDGLYKEPYFSHLSFKEKVNFSNKPILTDDLSMDGQKNVHIIDYLDHDDYNKTPF